MAAESFEIVFASAQAPVTFALCGLRAEKALVLGTRVLDAGTLGFTRKITLSTSVRLLCIRRPMQSSRRVIRLQCVARQWGAKRRGVGRECQRRLARGGWCALPGGW